MATRSLQGNGGFRRVRWARDARPPAGCDRPAPALRHFTRGRPVTATVQAPAATRFRCPAGSADQPRPMGTGPAADTDRPRRGAAYPRASAPRRTPPPCAASLPTYR
ncbi:hypothetical protein GCM10009535_01100 [Streptomyces thermocarboxydovorans]|uniref:Uncharacterized protein n=1 Tax=Streptomyces thermocarboxydovorans TaxID=59298 RepID=A0ABN1H5M5_9ACTN